jgi:hypothetical protein
MKNYCTYTQEISSRGKRPDPVQLACLLSSPMTETLARKGVPNIKADKLTSQKKRA